MLLETEFAVGILARLPSFVMEKLLLRYFSICRGRERFAMVGTSGAAKKPGRKGLDSQEQKEGGSGWLQEKRRGEGIEKVPLIIDLQQLSLYLTIWKNNILVPQKN